MTQDLKLGHRGILLSKIMNMKKIFFIGGDENSMWNDTPHNNAKLGETFSFVNNIKDEMQLFTIVAILSSTAARKHWNIENHSNRRTLVLSKLHRTLKFSAYKYIVGYAENFKVQGTFKGEDI